VKEDAEKRPLESADERRDYVFISFVLHYLPLGVIDANCGDFGARVVLQRFGIERARLDNLVRGFLSPACASENESD